MSIDKEIASLEAKVAEAPNWRNRLEELNAMLSTPTPVDTNNFLTG